MSASTQQKQEFHPNGTPKFDGAYINGKEEGKHTRWYPDKQVLSAENYLKGYKLGEQEGWYSDGKRWYISRYSEDEEMKEWKEVKMKILTSLNGLQEGWYPNGQKASNDNFLAGKRDGLQEGWHLNGQKAYADNFLVGKKEGLQEGWHPNGNPAYIENYKNGQKIGQCQAWDEKGKIIENKTY